MVLNLFQLRNLSGFTFQLNNLENPSNNYVVAPYRTSASQDMWLAKSNGSRGVSIHTFFQENASLRQFLFMWDEDYNLRYRVGWQVEDSLIAVTDGTTDFSIEVYETHFKFISRNRPFNGSTTEVTVQNWKEFVI